ncbi:hypothetical protein Tco_0394691 [Tanacetum coccineum]
MVVEVAATVWQVVMMMMMYGVDDRFGGDVDDGGGWRGSAGVYGDDDEHCALMEYGDECSKTHLPEAGR